MIGAEFVSTNGRIPVIITGHKTRELVEVLAVKHAPFIERGACPPQTHAVKRGYVLKSELARLRSTRIIESEICELCGKPMTDGWCQSCWKDEEIAEVAMHAVDRAYEIGKKVLEEIGNEKEREHQRVSKRAEESAIGNGRGQV